MPNQQYKADLDFPLKKGVGFEGGEDFGGSLFEIPDKQLI